jgi:hypothetical protein
MTLYSALVHLGHGSTCIDSSRHLLFTVHIGLRYMKPAHYATGVVANVSLLYVWLSWLCLRTIQRQCTSVSHGSNVGRCGFDHNIVQDILCPRCHVLVCAAQCTAVLRTGQLVHAVSTVCNSALLLQHVNQHVSYQ